MSDDEEIGVAEDYEPEEGEDTPGDVGDGYTLEEVPKRKPTKKLPGYSAGKPSRLPKEKLMTSEGIIPLQSGTNIWDSQKGMTGFGRPRDVLDKIIAHNFKPLSEDKQNALNEVVRLQSGSNRFDSQKGMSPMGNVRDVLYKPKGTGGVDEVSEEKQRMRDGIVPLQSGTNKLASQKGMRGFGMPRLTFTKEFLDPCPESQGNIGAQMGTNKLASQKGMTGFGATRNQVSKYVDEARGEIANDETAVMKQSLGSSLSHANQSGMAMFGSFRNNTMMSLGRVERASQGFVPFQSGINWADSQAGKTAFGQPRNQVTVAVDDTREPLPEELARDPNTPMWSCGYQYGASQRGMTAIGAPRDVKGRFVRRLW